MIVLRLAVCQMLHAPFAGAALWILGQLIAGLVVGWWLQNTTVRWQSLNLNLNQAPTVSLPRHNLPDRRAA
jgi:hypothetical protein